MSRTRRAEVEVVNGIYLPDMFGVVMPEATTNMVANPSAENDLTGYAMMGFATAITRTNAQQRRGIYSIAVTPGGGVLGGGIEYSTIVTTAGQVYTASVDVLGKLGFTYTLSVGIVAGVVLTLRQWTSNGEWQRIYLTYSDTLGGNRRIVVEETSPSFLVVQDFYVDGFQFENKNHPTTYCDGDLEGFVIGETAYGWNGTYHGSTSFRVATTRSGGRIVNLKDYGFNLIGSTGLGLAAPLNYSLPSNLGGAYYQNTVNDVRNFSLVGDIITKDNLELSSRRRDLENAFAHDITPYRQPLLLHFQELNDCNDTIGDEVFIKCLYAGGLERNYDNLNGEKILLNFTAFDKASIWIDGEYAKTLNYNTTYAHSNITRIGADGTIGTFGTGANLNVACAVKDEATGNIYIGGYFTAVNGVAANYIAMYSNGVWSALGAGMAIGAGTPVVYALALKNGILYAGGKFDTAGGVASPNIAAWNTITGAWAAMGAGLTGGAIRSCYTVFVNSDNSYVYAGGTFTTAGAGVATNIARWNISTSAWSALTMGAAEGCNLQVMDIISNNLTDIWVCGYFATSGGITTNCIARWNTSGNWYALGTGFGGVGAYGKCMVYTKNGELVVGGGFLFIDGAATIPCKDLAVWNGSSWRALYAYVTPEDMAIDGFGLLHVVGASYDPGQPTVGASDRIGMHYEILSTSVNDVINQAHAFRMFGSSYNSASQSHCILIDAIGSIIVGGRFDRVQYGYMNAYDNLFPKFPEIRIDNVGIVESCLPLTIETMYDEEGISFFKTLSVAERSTITKYQWISNFGDRTNYLSKTGSYFQLDSGDSLPIYVLVAHTYTETGDNNNQLSHYGMMTGQNLTNTRNGQMSFSIIADGGGFYHVGLFDDAARAPGDLMGHTATYNAVGWQAIVADNNSGLSGYIYIDAVTAADVNIEVTFGIVSISMNYRNYIRSLSDARYT